MLRARSVPLATALVIAISAPLSAQAPDKGPHYDWVCRPRYFQITVSPDGVAKTETDRSVDEPLDVIVAPRSIVLDTDPEDGPLLLDYRLKIEMRLPSGERTLFSSLDSENYDGGVGVETENGRLTQVRALQGTADHDWISVQLRKADHGWQILAYGSDLTTDRDARIANILEPKPPYSPAPHFEPAAVVYVMTGPCVMLGRH